MLPTLTDEQRDALAAAPGAAVEVEDAATRARYVLVSAAIFDRVKTLVSPERFDVAETYGAVEAALREVWNDPEMDVYDDYDANPEP